MKIPGPTAEIRAFLLLHHDEAFGMRVLLDRMGVAHGNNYRRSYYDAIKGLMRGGKLLCKQTEAGATYQINLAAPLHATRSCVDHADRVARKKQRYHARRAAEGRRTLEQFRAEVRAAADARADARAADRAAKRSAAMQSRRVVSIRCPAAVPRVPCRRRVSAEPLRTEPHLCSKEWEAAGGQVERLPGIERFIRERICLA